MPLRRCPVIDFFGSPAHDEVANSVSDVIGAQGLGPPDKICTSQCRNEPLTVDDGEGKRSR